jgi:glutamate decarboxylase
MTAADDNLDEILRPAFAGRLMSGPLPKNRLPDHESSADTVEQLIREMLLLDGHARLNQATFVTTWMEPQAEQLMAESFDKNMIDKDEYPATAEIERRCQQIVCDLFHGAPAEKPFAVSTVGSSEAVMLSGLAMKWNWRARQQAKDRPTDRPNLVLGTNVQVVWEKFCRYWDVEPRYVPMADGRYVVTPELVVERCDEHTIGVVGILGTTFTGEYEPIEAIHDAVVAYNAANGTDIPVHVDAASGGFVAPFLQPDLPWDFRLPNVRSINVSGHKYGLVYPGIGFAAWRSEDLLPEDLIFRVNYLGGDMPTFTLNFSRPGNQVVGQYYNFLRLGRAGYTAVMQRLQDLAQQLAAGVDQMDSYDLVSDGSTIPVVAFSVAASEEFTAFDVSAFLRQYGWQVPAYTMPADAEDVAVLRVVVREGFDGDLLESLLGHLQTAVEHLRRHPNLGFTRSGFSHT